MKIANNVEMLTLGGERGALYPVLVWGEGELVLIDAGLPGEAEKLRGAVEAAGHSPEDITKVILTHQDLDHIGSAKVLSETGAKIYAHEAEAPYIRGDVPSIRLTDMEARFDQLSEEEKAFYHRAKMGAPMFYVNVDVPLGDGERLDICGGIRILHTPGHTPGHICVLLDESSVLVAGDAANIEDGRLVGADPQFTRDAEQAQASFEKIRAAGAKAVVCYHGGVYNNP